MPSLMLVEPLQLHSTHCWPEVSLSSIYFHLIYVFIYEVSIIIDSIWLGLAFYSFQSFCPLPGILVHLHLIITQIIDGWFSFMISPFDFYFIPFCLFVCFILLFLFGVWRKNITFCHKIGNIIWVWYLGILFYIID